MGDTNGNGIPDSSSGIPQTLYQSQQYTCDPNSDNLQLNSKGDKVIELQTYLSDLGYGDLLGTGKIDGEFGANTQNSVMAYQRDFGIPSKGVVDLQTWFSLCEQVSSLPKTFSK
jgi:peptidoglycan hydrolase-like protein with peptidoglycan-binding domain